MEALTNRGAKNNTTENFINEKWTLLLSSFSICLIIIFTPNKVSELTNDKISLDLDLDLDLEMCLFPV